MLFTHKKSPLKCSLPITCSWPGISWKKPFAVCGCCPQWEGRWTDILYGISKNNVLFGVLIQVSNKLWQFLGLCMDFLWRLPFWCKMRLWNQPLFVQRVPYKVSLYSSWILKHQGYRRLSEVLSLVLSIWKRCFQYAPFRGGSIVVVGEFASSHHLNMVSARFIKTCAFRTGYMKLLCILLSICFTHLQLTNPQRIKENSKPLT